MDLFNPVFMDSFFPAPLPEPPAVARESRHKRQGLKFEEQGEEEFRKNFRLTKSAFTCLMNKLVEFPSSNSLFPDNWKKTVIPRETRLMLVIWYLATPDSYRSIAANFCVNESVVFDSVIALCNLLLELEDEYIVWPDEQEQRKQMSLFQTKVGFPGVVGCLDGTHIRINRPTAYAGAYYNRKGYHSISVMLLCDAHHAITYYSIGSPGSYHDARVFRRSEMFVKINELPSTAHVLGDSAYPLTPNLVTPFKGEVTGVKKSFNKKHSSTRITVENAIGRLKGMWRRLNFVDSRSMKNRLIIRAGIILHNFILKEDTTLAVTDNPPVIIERHDDANEKRNYLVTYLAARR